QGWARTLRAMRLRVLKAHKDRCTFEVSLDTENGWQSVIGKVHDVDRSDVVGVMQSIVDAGFGPTAEFAIPRPLTYVPSLHVLLRDLEAAIPTPGSFEPCAGHGSYMPEHVILSGRRTMVIDLDEYDVADPARDLAWFIVSLERLGLKKRGSLRAHDQSVDAFQD